MAENVVHCPYCVLGDDFRLMVQRPGWFICENCGHIMIPTIQISGAPAATARR